jgi:DNA-binding transcriptional LysR family regulator
MDIRELGRLDLNLLVALEALLEERNVSRAAERLFITQSAMSKTLGRLRELFDDPLFVRKSGSMVPTPRAEQLAEYLPLVLQAVQGMFQPVDFDPLAYEGNFTLLAQGHTGVWAMPRLLERLSRTAPGIRLRSISHVDDQTEDLASGKLDFLLQAERQHYPPELELTTLGFAPPVLLARVGHPLEGQEITWEKVLQYPQVSLLLTEIAEIQFITDANSLFLRHEAMFKPHLETDNLFTAIQTVLRSDYLFPAPPLFVEQDELVSGGLTALPLPEGEDVTLKYVLVKHQRVRNSRVHEFLYQEIIETTEEFRRDYELPPLARMRAERNLAY